jgi:hypothetical protein
MKYITKGSVEMKFLAQNIALTATIATLYYVLSLRTRYVSAVAIPEIKMSFKAFIASIFRFKITQHFIMQRGIINAR